MNGQPGTPAGATSDGPGSAPVDDRALTPPSRLSAWLKTRAAWIFLLDFALVVLFIVITPEHVFGTTENVKNLLLALAEILLLALGLTMMLGAGIFDLSLGANLVLSSVVGGKVMLLFAAEGAYGDPTLAIIVALGACILTGAIFGLVNGILIAIFEVNSLIATLATLGIGTGVADLLTGGTDIAGFPESLQTGIGQNTFLSIFPVPALAAFAALLVLWTTVRFLRYGTRVQAIGSSRAAATRAGIRVPGVLISLTILGGALAGVAGFIDLARFGASSLSGHGNDALNAVTAAVIGGTLLEGGFITVIGTLWGACLGVILQTGLVLSGVSSYWQLIAVGAVLLVAVVLDRFAARRRTRIQR